MSVEELNVVSSSPTYHYPEYFYQYVVSFAGNMPTA